MSLFALQECKVLSTTSGAVATMVSKATAGPVGRRRCCSQFCKVRVLTRIKRANSLCDKPVRSRTACTSVSGSGACRPTGRFLPRASVFASFRLCTKSLNKVLSISQLLRQFFDTSNQSIALRVGQQQVLQRSVFIAGEQCGDEAGEGRRFDKFRELQFCTPMEYFYILTARASAVEGFGKS